MSARLPAVLLLLLIATATSTHAQELEPAWLEVADVRLRLREGPSTDDDIITLLTPREVVELLQRGEEWSHIRRQDGTTGWSHNDYLLPLAEPNRPDARRIGEQRVFRIYDAVNSRRITLNAELRAISDHVYFYTHARRGSDVLPEDRALQRSANLFDERIYQQTLDFWGVEDPPDIDGDERIVILVVAGYNPGVQTRGWYAGRNDMPQEASYRGTGFIGISLAGYGVPVGFSASPSIILSTLAHEFLHMLHHQTGGNGVSWVDDGLATLWQTILERVQVLDPTQLTGSFPAKNIQLNLRHNPNHFMSMLFMLYIQERLGRETLREFATHPEEGLDALDAVLASHEDGLDADTFFADWVLTNILFDSQRQGGQFGYQLLPGSELSLPAISSPIRQLPAGFLSEARPYSAIYYELPPSAGGENVDRLLLDLRLRASAPQDAWLQMVEVLPERIVVQRFRASEYRDRPAVATLSEASERRVLAISPFTPGARLRTQPVRFTLALRALPTTADAGARVTAVLNLRRTPEIGDNILGRLRPCSFVQVLQREAHWSQVRNDDGLIGWSHNDFLYHPDSPAPERSGDPCATLPRAAHSGNVSEVQSLLAGGVPVNSRDVYGRTALHEAAFWGHERVIASLLRAGADAGVQDNAGRTPLDEALYSGDANSIAQLVRAREGLDLSDPAIRPLLIDAAATGNNDLLGKILASNHDVNWRDASGRTALAAAAENGREEALRQLLAAGADHSLPDKSGHTPLMRAAASGKVGALAILHKAGARINDIGLDRHTALMLAAANGHALAVAWLLLIADAWVHDAQPDNERSALHLAAANGHEAVVAMLLLRGADPAAPDRDGFTPLHLARAAGHDRAARFLNMVEAEEARPVHPRPDWSLLPATFAAASHGNLEEVDRLINDATPFKAHNSEGLTPLMLAARGGHPDVVLLLLLAGAHPDQRGNMNRDEPALFFTIRSGHDVISAMLLLAGAFPGDSPNIVFSTNESSALTWAADYGREDIVHLLLGLRGNRQRNVNERGTFGRTPLIYAVSNGHTAVVRTLLAAGADPTLLPTHRNIASILDFCGRSCNQEMRNSLLAAVADA
ncbi:MAG: ankyrin repeat domain-containing protein [Anaerolineaceae bacterium]|nr:ankyrin repeat domain-containing protein [Anaerolineaceae bacterium]